MPSSRFPKTHIKPQVLPWPPKPVCSRCYTHTVKSSKGIYTVTPPSLFSRHPGLLPLLLHSCRICTCACIPGVAPHSHTHKWEHTTHTILHHFFSSPIRGWRSTPSAPTELPQSSLLRDIWVGPNPLPLYTAWS